MIFLLDTEFSSQLPHDGGAFYTTDTMESARPYYLESWAPILHAATLWLNARGFESSETSNVNTNAKSSIGNNNNNNTSNTDSNVERFHLLFGKPNSVHRHNDLSFQCLHRRKTI